MSSEKVLNQLKDKKAKLKEIVLSGVPNDPKLLETHTRRVIHARSFIGEISEVIEILESDATGIELKLVPHTTFDKVVARADFATEEFDGIYCRVCNICNYPSRPMLIISTTAFKML